MKIEHKLEWNKKLLENIPKLAQTSQASSFLEKQASKFKNRVVEIVPENLGQRKYSRAPLKNAITISRTKPAKLRVGGKSIQSLQITVGLKPAKKEYIYALAGRRIRKPFAKDARKIRKLSKQKEFNINKHYITYKYQKPTAKSAPFARVYNKRAQKMFNKEFEDLAKTLINDWDKNGIK
ncbi:Uncharacterised protein [Mesomycoplasma conjunctivae]|nr:Uncharacterised protein [Mesomycoplasma conjunctivae]